ncbi:Eco57I restriction-modification methylase domain-containing protein [Riemerella anatipestifer]|uniref:Eco57I restriction-modification methylase domain-containing protein n=1 Tax=Riemerella anatipestifer TaxID=34085 RepID=UPI0021D5906E|nr:N-6 DNA methylase [Riemerella anatipestifer]MCU7543284.1 Eco57I restriction-modification methylase domain-containing protein [Riemerella anatipestifer]MCW0514097.1 Eco57I restriction-modification methylase domain-containing protein [Riemerella anatipestifer]
MDKLIQNFSVKLLSDFFKNNANLKPQLEDLTYIVEDKDFSDFSELTRIGNVEFKNSDELIVFCCKHKGILTERSSKRKQFEIAKLVLKEDFKDGAIFVFYDDAGKFRFSFIRRNWDGKADKKYSSWKRFTYFVSPEDTNKTFKHRIGNCTFKDLDAIQEAFSVEKLTKEFYNDLFKWYQWTLESEVGITFPNNTSTSDDDRVKLEEQMIRLITRLLFVWFIKQKHLVPDELFKKDRLSEILNDFNPESFSNGNYYNAILQNLFFATLNKAVIEREFAKLADKRDIKTRYRYSEMFKIAEEEVLNLFRPIPFLNGGLFECLDKEESTDGVKYHLDGFSRSDKKFPNGNLKHRAFIPNVVFFGDDKNEGLIPLLERYNFTVEENVPNEVQVALDPELLGNVFENLLGAFNPETQESARKQSGSFYTPKEIVAYMVDESLIAFLENSLSFGEGQGEAIRQLFEQENLPESLADDHDLCEKIANTLRSVKILDPACGSGAFPMGILNRMVEVLEKLDAKNKASHHDLKLHLIEECIYGVDIQTIAAQISKLRFFISLIVEQEAMDLSKPEENYGVLTLPNLETKFVAANTLIGMKKKKEGDFVNSLFTDPRIDETKHQLMEVRKEHFYAKSAYKKKELRDKDAQLRAELSKLLQDNNEFAPEDAIQFSQWNPYDQNASSPFFDPEWMFGLEEGFDIVIGNPPYVQLQKESGRLAKMYQNCEYKTFAKTGDIYSLFYERGWQLLKNRGFLCYITSNKWMRAGYGENTRKFFTDNTNPILLIDFAGQKIFESATVDTNILLFSKDKNRQETKACVIKEKVLNNLSVYFRQNANLTEFKDSESWVVLSPIEKQIKEKIEKVGTPLKDWDIRINYGIKTGFNDAFIIDGAKRKELIAKDPKSAEIIRPILRGRDIKRYSYDFADLWLINTHNGIKEKGIKPINIDNYPAVKAHLDNYYPQLEKRADKGDTPYNLRNCAYMEDFYKQKISWNRISHEKLFSLVDKGIVIQDSMHFFTGKHLEYLCGILNSKLISWFMYLIIGDAAGGNAGNSDNVKNLNIPKPSIEIEKQIERLIKNEQYNEIDKVVYRLYSISEEEKDFIELL